MALCYLEGKKSCFREIVELLSYFLTVKLKMKALCQSQWYSVFIQKEGKTGQVTTYREVKRIHCD